MIQRIFSSLRDLPFIRFILFFLLGIFFQINLNLELKIYLVLLLIFFILIVLIYQKKNISKSFVDRYLFGLLIYLVFFITGSILVIFKSADKSIIINKKIVAEGIITTPPELKEKTVRFVVDLSKFLQNDTLTYSEEKILVFVSKDSVSSKLQYGDKILFNGKASEVVNPGNPEEFDYKRFLFRKGITSQIFLASDKLKIISHNKANPFLSFALKIRTKLSNIYSKNGITGQEYGVLAALTLGDRSGLDSEIIKSYAISGTMHILSVSGLHVAIVYLIINYLLFFLDKIMLNGIRIGMILKMIIIISFLWFFAFISGLSPSVNRAAIMFSFVVLGNTFNRKIGIFNSLASSAFILLIINPFDATDVGFQMSYIAVISIILFEPLISNLFFIKNKILKYIWALTAVSIAAQLGTASVSMFYFHFFPNWFFVSNILVIPISTIIMYVSALLFAISFIPIISSFVGLALKYLVFSLNYVVKSVEYLPFSYTSNIPFSLFEMLIFSGIIAALYLFVKHKDSLFLKMSLILVIAYLSNSILFNIQKLTRTNFYVYNAGYKSAINLISPVTNKIFVSDTSQTKNSMDFVVKNNLISLGKSDFETESIFKDTADIGKYIDFEGKRFLIINNKSQIKYNSKFKLKVDYIILSKNIYIEMEDLKRLYNPDLVIFDSSNKIIRIERWREECKEQNLKFWSVPEQGAFCLEF